MKEKSICAAFLAILLAGWADCAEPPENRPNRWARSIEVKGVPNLFKVSDSLYRSAQPTAEGMRNLKELGIVTVVNLRSFHSDRDEIDNTGLAYEHIYMKAWHPERKEVVRFLQIVTDPKRAPVLVHCQHGSDRTGTMAALYRVAVQGWSKEDAIREMTKGGFGFNEIWVNLPDWINDLDVDSIRREAGIKTVDEKSLAPTPAAKPASDGKRPNIVLVMLDDVGYSDYGCFGGEIATPNIDRLAAEGIFFTQFYNNAVCVPTRAALITGLYPRYSGQNRSIALSNRMVTIAEVLRDAGYRTSLSGKWHLGREAPHHPLDRGFEVYYGLLDGCCNHHDPSIRDPQFEGGRKRVWADGRRTVTEFADDFYSTDAITDHALSQMESFHESDKPFFVHICYTAAHSPLHAKPSDIAKYRGRYASGWESLRRTRFQQQQRLGIVERSWPLSIGEPELTAWKNEPLKEWNENLMAVYAAMVDCIDQNIGRVMDKLTTLGVAQNTIVMVLNDNGGCAEQAGGDDPTNVAGPAEHYVSCGAGWAHAQNTPWRRYKAWCHEGGIATPLIVRWPQVVSKGKRTNRVGHVMDIMPTLLEAAGAAFPLLRADEPTIPIEGVSLLPTFRSQAQDVHSRELYWAWQDNRAIRAGDWKLVWDQEVGRWELYDFATDRVESKDLAGQQPQRVAELAARWQTWAEKTGAIHRVGQKIRLKPE